MKLIAGINDVGVNYQIVSVFQGDEETIFEFGGVRLYEISSIECYNAIETSLEANQSVFFAKNLINPLVEGDLIIQAAEDAIVAAALGARNQARQFTSNRVGSLSMFDFYGFTIINNRLIDLGYVITDENREAKYLEIINAGDQAIIDALDIYLDLRDKLDERKSTYDIYKIFSDEVILLTTVEDIEARLATFYSAFN